MQIKGESGFRGPAQDSSCCMIWFPSVLDVVFANHCVCGGVLVRVVDIERYIHMLRVIAWRTWYAK